MKKLLILVLALSLFSCKAQEEPTTFSAEALSDTFVNLKGKNVMLQSILGLHKGKTIVVDVWASWCRDCIVGMPILKALQEENKDVVFLFLSLDKSQESWKKGIKKYKLNGEHYYIQSGWDGAFGKFIDLDWIPRYMVIDKGQNIKLFRAVKANDIKLKTAL